MKLYRDTVLRDAYDVIVVGAGLGGMIADSLLAKRGLSVLLIDQQNKPGSACTSFIREDHVFDVGAAMLYGFGEKGFRPFHFLINELEEPIDVIPHKTLARMTFEGNEIVLWPDIDRFLEELYQLFLQEKSGLKSFYTDLYKLYKNVVIKNQLISPPSELSPRQKLLQLLSDPLVIIKVQRLLSTSTLNLMKKYLHTPEVINFFDKLCSAYSYTTAEQTPAVFVATMFIDNHVGEVYFPADGAQMLPNIIEKAFERDNGQVIYRQLVDEILFQGGKICGVRLIDGRKIRAERVIANATVWNIYGKLIKPAHIDPERLKWAHSLIPTFPSMTLYMILEGEGFTDNLYPWEIFNENRKVVVSLDLRLYINSLVDATLCPPDHLVVMAMAPNLCQWPHADEPGYHSPEYEYRKQREAERMLDQIEQHIQGFRKHICSLIIGTPTTIERYLLKNGHPDSGLDVVVIGGGPSALSCAYYLILAGYQVKVFTPETRAGGELWLKSQANPLLHAAVQSDVQGIISSGLVFTSVKVPGENLDLCQIQEHHHVVYIADATSPANVEILGSRLGVRWREKIDPKTGQLVNQSKVFMGEEYTINYCVSVLEAVAYGRRAAYFIGEYLRKSGVSSPTLTTG
jgi:prolycopene isomerase